MPEVTVRRATVQDVPSMVQISAGFRSELARMQPVMWSVAEDANRNQELFFRDLVSREGMDLLVAEKSRQIDGFLIASYVGAPPVYAPGGLTCLVDDFAMRDPLDWDHIGGALLDAIREHAIRRGSAQIVVICPHLLGSKRKLLQAQGLSIASEWWTCPLVSESER